MNGINKTLVVANTITLAIMLFVNYSSSTGLFSSVTVASVSYRYDTLFAPAGYAFAIWGVIFLFCISFVIYQWVLLNNGDRGQYIQRTGWWFVISNIFNTLWIFCWTNNQIGLSVICILGLLISLSVMVVRLRLELDDEPVLTVFFVWWPIVLYLGWMMVATIACIAAWLVSTGWHGGGAGEVLWTMILIGVAALLFVYLVQKRNLREAAGVGIWAFIAIAVKQWNLHQPIAIAAIAASIFVFIVISIHGYRNRDFSLFKKAQKGEWR